MQAIAARERLVQAAHFDERTRQYLDLKIDGIRIYRSRSNLIDPPVCYDDFQAIGNSIRQN